MRPAAHAALLVLLMLRPCTSLDAFAECSTSDFVAAVSAVPTSCAGASDVFCSQACRFAIATVMDHIGANDCQPFNGFTEDGFKESLSAIQNTACGYTFLMRQMGDDEAEGTDVESWTEFKQIFADHYAFFIERSVDWAATIAAQEVALGKTLGERMVGAISVLQGTGAGQTGDGHVSIENGDGEGETGGLGPAWARPESNVAELMSIARQQATQKEIVKLNAAMDYGLIKDDILYINIHKMEGLDPSGMKADGVKFAEGLNAIFNSPSANSAKGVVLDLRFNGGGYDFVSMHVLGFFMERATHVMSKKTKVPRANTFTADTKLSSITSSRTAHPFLGPMVVLQSRFTMSAGETCTMGFHARTPKPTFVGEETWGCFSDIMSATLPNGVLLGLSNQRYTDLEGNSYEAVGSPLTGGSENNIPMGVAGSSDPQIARAVAVLKSSSYKYNSKSSGADVDDSTPSMGVVALVCVVGCCCAVILGICICCGACKTSKGHGGYDDVDEEASECEG